MEGALSKTDNPKTHVTSENRDAISLQIDSLSQFSKGLRAQMMPQPKQSEMLTMIARAAGYRNYQHLRAQNPPQTIVDIKQVDRALRAFDGQGRLARWPGKTQIQALALWGVWAGLPARIEMTEREISLRIDTLSTLRDAAQIRRSLVENALLSRNKDGSCYRRIEQPPTPEGKRLIAHVGGL